MNYKILLYLEPVLVELPIRVKGEEAEKVQRGFNVKYMVYKAENGSLIREGVEEKILELEINGKIHVVPPVLLKNSIVLTVFVEKGVISRRGNLLVLE